MEQFINFITQHYLLFDIITLFLILALIGYFVNIKKQKSNVFKINNAENEINDIPINTNMSLQDFVNDNKSVGTNTNNNFPN